MSALNPAPFSRLASASVRGLVGTAAQTFGGPKTFSDGVISSKFRSTAGSGADVAVGPSGDDNTGLWFPAPDTINVVTAGTLRSQWTATGVFAHQGPLSIPTNSLLGVGNLSALYESSGLRIYNGLGAGNTDVAVRAGTSVADASVHSDATIFSFRTGIGGSEVESFGIKKTGRLVGAGGQLEISNSAGSRLSWGQNGLVILAGSGEFATVGVTVFRSTATGSDQVQVRSASSGAGVRAVTLGTSAASAGVNAACQLTAFATDVGGVPSTKAFVTAGGEFESTVVAAGIVLRSPDGTRYRLTIANGGTVAVAAA